VKKMYRLLQMSEPDWVQRNGTWLLSVFGVFTACFSGLLVYALKSRCKKIRCCGAECERDVVALEPNQITLS
jgi:hypothetical protein